MKKITALFIFLISCSSLGLAASLKEEKAYVVETDESTASESLNRVSGNIDLGFAAPENTFKSEDQDGVGPFAKEKAQYKKNNESVY